MKPLIYFLSTLVVVSCGTVRSGQQPDSVRNARGNLQLFTPGFNQDSNALSHEERINLARQHINLPLPGTFQLQQANQGSLGLNVFQQSTQQQPQLRKELVNQVPYGVPELQQNNLLQQQQDNQQQFTLNQPQLQTVDTQQLNQREGQLNLGQNLASNQQLLGQQLQTVDAQQLNQRESQFGQNLASNQQLLGQQFQLNLLPQLNSLNLQSTSQPQVSVQPQLGLLSVPQSQLSLLQNLPRINLQQFELSQAQPQSQQQQIQIPQPTQFPQLQFPSFQQTTQQVEIQQQPNVQQSQFNIPQPQLSFQEFASQQNLLNLQQTGLNLETQQRVNIPQPQQPQQLNLQEQQFSFQQQIQPTQLPQLQVTSVEPTAQPVVNIPRPTPVPQQQQAPVQPQPEQIQLDIPKVGDAPPQRQNAEANVQQGGLIHKHVYFHVAPEDPEPVEVQPPPVFPPPRTHYKIIFIKAPTPAPVVQRIITPPVQEEEKTIVYVLVRKAETPKVEVPPPPPPTAPSKPEVYFIKYRAQKELQGQSEGGQGVPVVEEAIRTVENADVEPRVADSGESVLSTSVSTTAAPVYGPPGYQEGNS